MIRINQMKESKKLSYFIYFIFFSFMLALNYFTPKCVDDYCYMISLATIERIRGIRDIFSSLYIHAFTMNGRLIAHFFVYIFDWLPKSIFNFLNAGMYLMLIILTSRIISRKTNNLLLVLVFMLIWVFELDFGQVNLWLTGSCNYLWGHVFFLLFILPYYDLYCFNKRIKGKIVSVFFLLFAFFVGAYNEVTSFSALLFCSVFLFLSWKSNKLEQLWVYFFAIILCGAGALSLFLSPAEHGKSGDLMSVDSLVNGFARSAKVYLNFLPLILIWVILFFVAAKKEAKDKRLISSTIFFGGSVCANFLLVAASSYPGRCAAVSLILLIVADGILICDLPLASSHGFAALSAAIVIPFFCYFSVFGVYDIYNTGVKIKSNEQIIAEAVSRGEERISIPCVYPNTKYSAIYNLKYIDLERPDIWPNENMATYYGVERIEGTE